MTNTTRPVPPNHCLVVAVVCLCLCFLILGAVSCEAQERTDTPLRLVQWGIIGSQLADAITTHRAISSGVGREANPAMGWVANRPYVLTGVKLATGIGISYAIGKVAKRNRPAALILGSIVAGSVGVIAVRNSRIR